MIAGWRYMPIEVGRVRPGDEIKSANGRTWLPRVRHIVQERPSSEPGIVSIWWGDVPAADRRPDTRILADTTVRIRRPKQQ